MISIIICTYNRDKYLYNCLKSIAENDFCYTKYEIVLINNNSTDNTQAECNRFYNDFSQVIFRYFVEEKQGLSYARNRGIAEAKGEILVYVDDDATVNSAYLKSIADFFTTHPNVYAAGGAIIPVYETEEPQWMSYYTRPLITGYKYNGEKIQPFRRGDYPGGGNAAYRKEVFEQIGLYNTNLGRKANSLMGAEEKDIYNKMRKNNMAFFYLPNMILYHIISPNKLTDEYFNRLTLSIGRSERLRTLTVSKVQYLKRLLLEALKWSASLLLSIYYVCKFQPQKGTKLLIFRWNVTKGLLMNT